MGAPHGRDCTPDCKAWAVSSPLNRGRDWITTPCPWCGARAGVACSAVSRLRLRMSRPHPSRLGAA